MPYAHHTKSIVENDPVVLPNGRIYGSERLAAFNKKVGTDSGFVRDPVGGMEGVLYEETELLKVYIM